MENELIVSFLTETGRMIADRQVQIAEENGICGDSVERVLNLGTQAFNRYKAMKNGEITGLEYVSEILTGTGDEELSAVASGVIMPIKTIVGKLGVGTPLTIPVAFMLSPVIAQVVSERIKNRETAMTQKLRYYESKQAMYRDFMDEAREAENNLNRFVQQIKLQRMQYENLQRADMAMDKVLKDLYDSI